jgi:hypothetical protein
MTASMKPLEDLHIDPRRYYLSAAQRRALWHNEISMFIVLAMPVIVATFWYGSTIEVVVNGEVTAPASLGRGIGLTLIVSLFLIVAGAVRLFIQPAAERVANAQPIRLYRRLSFAAFDGFLIFLISFQTLTDNASRDDIWAWALPFVLGIASGLIAYVCMHAMVDIPRGTDVHPLDLWIAQIEDE